MQKSSILLPRASHTNPSALKLSQLPINGKKSLGYVCSAYYGAKFTRLVTRREHDEIFFTPLCAWRPLIDKHSIIGA
jgi:hypothetical protein